MPAYKLALGLGEAAALAPSTAPATACRQQGCLRRSICACCHALVQAWRAPPTGTGLRSRTLLTNRVRRAASSAWYRLREGLWPAQLPCAAAGSKPAPTGLPCRRPSVPLQPRRWRSLAGTARRQSAWVLGGLQGGALHGKLPHRPPDPETPRPARCPAPLPPPGTASPSSRRCRRNPTSPASPLPTPTRRGATPAAPRRPELQRHAGKCCVALLWPAAPHCAPWPVVCGRLLSSQGRSHCSGVKKEHRGSGALRRTEEPRQCQGIKEGKPIQKWGHRLDAHCREQNRRGLGLGGGKAEEYGAGSGGFVGEIQGGKEGTDGLK